MVIQIYDLTLPITFKELAALYSITEEEKADSVLGLEIRGETIDFPFLSIIKEKGIQFFTYQQGQICNILIPGSIYEFENCCARLKGIVAEGISYRIKTAIKNYKNYNQNKFLIGKKEFSAENVSVMGILNVTPDSFSDGGEYFEFDSAYLRAEEMIRDGADIIDVGGETTRPGSLSVKADEELRRIIPIIKKIHQNYPEVIISADTNKSLVAEEALKAGASIINDISGTTFDPRLLDVVKKYEAALVIMHIKGTPRDMQDKIEYKRLIADIYDFLYHRTSEALYEGVSKIFIDPGIGFSKTAAMNLELIKRLPDFKSMGFPILIGNSRKSFIGKISGEEVTNRDVPSIIIDTVSALSGAAVIRTHNVKNGVYLKKAYKALGTFDV